VTHFVESARKFINSEDAPSMVEYSLLIAMLAIGVAVAAVYSGH
jgi:Flp pilus assembly pilin Flp